MPEPQRRNRVVLSCAPCRNSKLKCDRQQPCSQCIKKSRVDLCQYAPKPAPKDRRRKAGPKTMATRLKQLEGMVRQMIEVGLVGPDGEFDPASFAKLRRRSNHDDSDEDGDDECDDMDDEDDEDTDEDEEARPKNIDEQAPSTQPRMHKKGGNASYIGATHLLSMLEDIEEMQGYFDDESEEEAYDVPQVQGEEQPLNEKLLFGTDEFHSRAEIISLLSDRTIVDRLVSCYFNTFSAFQLVIHRPTFTAEYAKFWEDPDSAPLHWIGLLCMICSTGIFLTHFGNPEDLAFIPDATPSHMELMQRYRSAAGWCLVYGRYFNPKLNTVPPLLLMIESTYIQNRGNQMDCYVLTGVLIRLSFKLGLHRDPDYMPNIPAFEGEMRRRMWSMIVCLDALISFHVGLPSMVNFDECDTKMPRNLLDSDFGPEVARVPDGRPISEFSLLSYPIAKTDMCSAFGRIARSANALVPPLASEVQRLDERLEAAWERTPEFLKVTPLAESVMKLPVQIIQSFTITGMYLKARCVLHRRYLTEMPPHKEHERSRRVCLDFALRLLANQDIIWESIQPGNVLRNCSWFLSSLCIHDSLLAAFIVYMIVQSPNYQPDGELSGSAYYISSETRRPSRIELVGKLQRSYFVWHDLARGSDEFKKTVDIVGEMIRKLGAEPGITPNLLARSHDALHDPSSSTLSSISTSAHVSMASGSNARHNSDVANALPAASANGSGTLADTQQSVASMPLSMGHSSVSSGPSLSGPSSAAQVQTNTANALMMQRLYENQQQQWNKVHLAQQMVQQMAQQQQQQQQTQQAQQQPVSYSMPPPPVPRIQQPVQSIPAAQVDIPAPQNGAWNMPDPGAYGAPAPMSGSVSMPVSGQVVSATNNISVPTPQTSVFSRAATRASGFPEMDWRIFDSVLAQGMQTDYTMRPFLDANMTDVELLAASMWNMQSGNMGGNGL